MQQYIVVLRVALLHIKSASIVKALIHRGHDDVIYVIIELLHYILNLLVSSKLSFIAATMIMKDIFPFQVTFGIERWLSERQR
jgi:hypothetical protein